MRSSYAQSLDLQRALDDRYGACWSLTYLGWAAQNEGDLATARQLHNEALPSVGSCEIDTARRGR